MDREKARNLIEMTEDVIEGQRIETQKLADQNRALKQRLAEADNEAAGLLTGVIISHSGDYATLGIKNVALFYYGYEKTVCPNHGNDSANCLCEEREWAFVVEEGPKNEVLRIPESQLGKCDTPGTGLILGIGHYLKWKAAQDGTE